MISLLGAPATTHAEPLPPGKLGMVTGVRNGVGPTDGEIGYGWTFGFEAAWQPMGPEQRLGWGINWTLLWAYFGAESGARITETLDLLELDLGGRLRLAPQLGRPLYVTLGAGAGLMRANAPLPPDNTRSTFGAYGSLGVEHGLWGTLLLSLELRTGFIGSEPTLATGLVGVGVSL